jgi:protein-L-isoaspartate(D-aspartate) O-methyltransferase
MTARPLHLALLLGCVLACRPNRPHDAPAKARDPYARERAQMVQEQLHARGIRDAAVLDAIRRVPRHRFVPPEYQAQAYADHPLPIGFEQTISQPYIVGYMTEAARVSAGERVLEIGTGSGYQAAVLAEIAGEVYSIEIVPELAERARALLAELGYRNLHVRTGDGYAGWRERAPFDAILVTAAPSHVPPALVAQLAVNGRMVIPVGTGEQEMRVITKTRSGVVESVPCTCGSYPWCGPTRPAHKWRRRSPPAVGPRLAERGFAPQSHR